MTESRPIRLLVVDDHAVVREGVASLIALEADMMVIGEATNGAEGEEAFHRLRPDITLMDLQMPVKGGVEAIADIRAVASSARIIVLTTFEGDVQAMRALKAGASGYLLKSSLRRELIDTIRSVHGGKRYVLPKVAQEIALHAAEAAQLDATFGDRMADRVAAIGGSWPFIGAFLAMMVVWMTLNVSHAFGVSFDPFPFILLNLSLSTLAALQAPIILMSQNRQAKKDRIAARHDYEVNLRAQLEIVRLSRKLDRMMHLAIRETKRAEETLEEVVESVRDGK